ncbi:hypothetical protein EXU85_03945 [Spirosoma sp. KCTC 42546]|uniref:hypothetical protein n=1 Tax=Spirosoma sp. KCTC 42546 TaxID=2520506 RepID=UPI0011597AC8|nr:hypothetical protein [Spirosoma sp. KCTC 42546]QDK77790.1 hypothetical protein EXU85_03945 [Spirosoma sp. KCTC 42546]
MATKSPVFRRFLSKKMIESDFIHGGRRCVSCNGNAHARAVVVALQHHTPSVPAVNILDSLFEFNGAGVELV